MTVNVIVENKSHHISIIIFLYENICYIHFTHNNVFYINDRISLRKYIEIDFINSPTFFISRATIRPRNDVYFPCQITFFVRIYKILIYLFFQYQSYIYILLKKKKLT